MDTKYDETVWISEAFMDGKWVVVTRSTSKFVASLGTVRLEILGTKCRLREEAK